MILRVKKQNLSPTRFALPVMWMLVAFYIGYHVFNGDRGIFAMMRDRREVTSLELQLADTRTDREKMELRVSHLRSGSLDRDLLDEQMRRMMGVMHKGEIVVLNNASH